MHVQSSVQQQQVPVHLLNNGGEQHSDQYKSLNLMEQVFIILYWLMLCLLDFNSFSSLLQVPTLLIDNITLTQSVAILEYLEETRPNKPLLPGDPKLKAKGLMIF